MPRPKHEQVLIEKMFKPRSSAGDQREWQQTATMPASDYARQVRLGIKKVRFMVKKRFS
jgi:hypothetical protein